MLRAIILIVVLAGCSTYQSVAGQYARDKARQGADASDFTLDAAVWGLCSFQHLGAVNRAFPEEDDLYRFINSCLWMSSKVSQ